MSENKQKQLDRIESLLKQILDTIQPRELQRTVKQ